MVCEHDGRGFVKGDGDETGSPCRAGGNGVRGVGDYVAWEAFESLVEEGEGYGGRVGGDDGPVALVVAYLAAVEGIVAHVVVLGDVRGYALDGEGPVFDAVCVAADDGTEVGVVCLVVADVVFGVVETEDYVLWVAILIVDVEVGQTGTVWDESRVNAWSRYGILLQRIGALRPGENEEEASEKESEGKHGSSSWMGSIMDYYRKAF